MVALVLFYIYLLSFNHPLLCQISSMGGIGSVPAMCIKNFITN